MSRAVRIFTLVLIFAAVITAVAMATQQRAKPGPMHFDIVTKPSEQAMGLGGRPSIPHNYGMLFVFPTPDIQGFWMKDMLVPIDIIWLSDSGKILGIEDSVSPSTYPQIFYSPSPVRFVLETRAGEVRAYGWHVGSTITLP